MQIAALVGAQASSCFGQSVALLKVPGTKIMKNLGFVFRKLKLGLGLAASHSDTWTLLTCAPSAVCSTK